MKRGLIEEGKATLRMKQDMKSDNYNMYDLIAYRIKVGWDFSFTIWSTEVVHLYAECVLRVSIFVHVIVHSTSTCRKQMVHLSQLWLHTLYCRFSWKYYAFGKSSNVSNVLLLPSITNRFIRHLETSSSVQLCTLEFESRRASYYWLLESLDLYHPYVWEYSRLSVTNTVLSKRKV